MNTSICFDSLLRRIAIVLALAALIPSSTAAQSIKKDNRVALVFTTSPAVEMLAPNPVHPNARVLLNGLGALGYVHGQNLTYITRSAEGRFERLRDIVRELAALKVDVIVASDNEIARLAREIAPGIPLVVIFLGDPVQAGLVSSLAKPGGSVTGLARTAGSEIDGKRLQLLKQAVPNARRVSFLGRDQDWSSLAGQSTKTAAKTLGVTLQLAQHTADNYAEAFDAITKERPEALYVAESTPNFANRRKIVDFALKQQLPAIYHTREFAQAGGLMSYGANLADLYRRAAGHVDKILKGADPGSLPIERADKFELVVNLKTAKTLGLQIPGQVLLLADQVIE